MLLGIDKTERFFVVLMFRDGKNCKSKQKGWENFLVTKMKNGLIFVITTKSKSAQ